MTDEYMRTVPKVRFAHTRQLSTHPYNLPVLCQCFTPEMTHPGNNTSYPAFNISVVIPSKPSVKNDKR